MRAAAKKRAGTTEKISVSIERDDLAALRRRAKRLYGGNLSAAIAEAVRRLREEEGRAAVVGWLGHTGGLTDEARTTIEAEWAGVAKPKQL